MLVTENRLDEWVRANAEEAQGAIVELVWRLVAASSPNPQVRRFPLGDSIGQPGPDGILETDYSYEPFVPNGKSLWEVGTGLNARKKANDDYNDQVRDVPEAERLATTFVFVTPLSGRRDWPFSWKPDAQATWLAKCKAEEQWKDIRVVDGTSLVDWLHHLPAVEIWLAQRIGMPVTGVTTLEWHWQDLNAIGSPPPLPARLFLAHRDAARAKLDQVLAGNSMQYKIETHFPDDVVDFVAAHVSELPADKRVDIWGQCLVVSDDDSWNGVVATRAKQILVADPRLDLDGAAGVRLLERAKRAGHAVVYGGTPGGIPHPFSDPLPRLKAYHVEEALRNGGYKDERARVLANASGGELGSLLRCIQNASLLPDWAESSAAADLAVAALLGAWNDTVEADRHIVEELAGKAYGEWIETIREVALRPGTPLLHHDGSWKFLARYEGWYALGPRLFDIHLQRLRSAALEVFSEHDPQFDLEPDERYASAIYGKTMKHSAGLRNGLAETLALLGAHPGALSSCSAGTSIATAAIVVRELFDDVDWLRWASLNDQLPLLAEAAPRSFLNAVDEALVRKPCPFDGVFAQEGGGLLGRTYITGLLWALETIAWEPEYFTHAVSCLGGLAARDLGGNWANRPANSLTTIFLPWLPQTCADFETRKTAIHHLMQELPGVGWALLNSLLPHSTSSSTGSQRPSWRTTIPDDWEKGVTRGKYIEQFVFYSKLAVEYAKTDPGKLQQLASRIEDLAPEASEDLFTHFKSADVRAMEDRDRTDLWNALNDVVVRHRKFSDADWALPTDQIEQVELAANALEPGSPLLRYQRLFRERDLDLYEEKGSYREQEQALAARRRQAMQEIIDAAGLDSIPGFARSTESPWRVGIACGQVANDDADNTYLPALLSTNDEQTTQFLAGFVWGRYSTKGWPWLDRLSVSSWSSTEIARLLIRLPFCQETWQRAANLLGDDEVLYWNDVVARPYDEQGELTAAVLQLHKYGRPRAAVRCLDWLRHNGHSLDPKLTAEVLLAAASSGEEYTDLDVYAVSDLIGALQEHPESEVDSLIHLEWAYLSLLDRQNGPTPITLERRLASSPEFFCELVQLVFASDNDGDDELRTPTDRQKAAAQHAFQLLHRWHTPPGLQADGTFDETAMAAWLEAVRVSSRASGHYDVALLTAGQVFAYAPPDPDGLWIHRAAARALDVMDAKALRSGFRTELFNSRGTHGFSAGREEREIAARYQSKADDIDAAGFPRLATTLRELADTYETDAARLERWDPFED